jgi:hypothetical protein
VQGQGCCIIKAAALCVCFQRICSESMTPIRSTRKLLETQLRVKQLAQLDQVSELDDLINNWLVFVIDLHTRPIITNQEITPNKCIKPYLSSATVNMLFSNPIMATISNFISSYTAFKGLKQCTMQWASTLWNQANCVIIISPIQITFGIIITHVS